MRCSRSVRRTSPAPELALVLALALAGACGQPAETPAPSPPPPASDEAAPAIAAPPPARLAWTYDSSDEGGAIALQEDGADVLRIACLTDGEMLIHGERFKPVASEERMSIGAGATVVTLVATPADDRDPPTVRGRGPIDADFVNAVGEGRKIAVNYGYQNMGPFDGPAAEIATLFVAACVD